MGNNLSSGLFNKILRNRNVNLIQTIIWIRVTCYMLNRTIFTSIDEEVRLYAVQVVVPKMKCRQPRSIDSRRYPWKVHINTVHFAQAVVGLGARTQRIERTRLEVLQKTFSFRAGHP